MKVLAVSFSYPPRSEPRAIQVSRLLRHLDIEDVVFCYGDEEGEAKECTDKRIIRIPVPHSTWRALSNRFVDRFNVPIFYRSPDHLRPWKAAVLKRVERLIESEQYRPDVVATFSFPLIDAVIGIDLKRKYGFPWIAHFSDPWVDSPFKRFDRLTRAVNLRLERQVIEYADRIVFTSPETAELVMKKYANGLHSKVRIVPHAYEPELFGRSENLANNRLPIRFLGELYQHRTPKPLFTALERLAKTDPSLVDKFSFEIIGDLNDLNLEGLGLLKLPKGLVLVRPPVKYSESLALMTSASGLMVIDAPVSGKNKSVFLPSKLVEYVGAGRPVLGLTPPGTAADLIRDLGGWVADPGNPEELERVTREFLNFVLLHKDGNSPWGNSEVRKRFELHNVVAAFQKVLTETRSNAA